MFFPSARGVCAENRFIALFFPAFSGACAAWCRGYSLCVVRGLCPLLAGPACNQFTVAGARAHVSYRLGRIDIQSEFATSRSFGLLGSVYELPWSGITSVGYSAPSDSSARIEVSATYRSRLRYFRYLNGSRQTLLAPAQMRINFSTRVPFRLGVGRWSYPALWVCGVEDISLAARSVRVRQLPLGNEIGTRVTMRFDLAIAALIP